MIDINGNFNDSNISVIVLSSGYEVEITDDLRWVKHLLRAIFGEFFLHAIKEYDLNMDDAVILMQNECKRLSILYKLPYALLILETMSYCRHMMMKSGLYNDYRWEDTED